MNYTAVWTEPTFKKGQRVKREQPPTRSQDWGDIEVETWSPLKHEKPGTMFQR